jgi:hypothetical protein
MTAPLLRRPEVARVAVPAGVAIALVPWIVVCARTYPAHPLQFDHTIYQYTAWSIRHGDRLYRDVAVPDGPFITWLHAVIQILVGESDAAFRWADLVIQVAGATAIGWVVAPLRRRTPWAVAIAALWLAQYFRYDWLWTAQREAYYAIAGYLGMGLLLLATRRRGRRAAVLCIAGGLAVGSQLFGKPTGLIFVALGALSLALGPPGRIRRAGWMLAGVALAVVLGALALALTASPYGFVFWYLRVPPLYRYLMGSAEPLRLLLVLDWHTTALAAIALAAGGVAIALRVLPRTCLGFVLAPALFLAAMVLQRKGYTYQAHPVTAGAYLVIALLAIELVRRRGRQLAIGAILLVLVVADATRELAHSWWIDPEIPTPTQQWGAPHDNNADLFAAAHTVATLTRPDDRVFAYGPAGKLLFEARRRSAVPPFNNFLLNIRRALKIEVSSAQRAAIDALQKEIARRSCPRLRDRPAAVVVCDGAYWSDGPGLSDAAEVCPQLAYVKPPDYVEVATIGCWHIHARRDRAGGVR